MQILDELNFTSDSIKLLDSFTLPFRIIQGSKITYSNRIPAENAELNINSIMDKSYILWDDEIIDYLKINRSNLRVDIKRNGKTEHLVIRINYDGSSCSLVISNYECSELYFKECIEYINTCKDFENIIIVDDDPVIMQTYKYIFDFLGYNTVLFSNPLYALEAVKSTDFDLLLSDYNMPDLNGLDLVKSLIEIKPLVPVIICSGLIENFSDQFRIFGNENCISLMKKPVTITKLSDRLEVVEFISRFCSFCRENTK